MKQGYNQQSLFNNNMKNNQLNPLPRKKKVLKNIDNNFNYSDSEDDNKEINIKLNNDKLKENSNSNLIMNNNINNMPINRVNKYNLNRSNREKLDEKYVNMKKNPNNNNINFNRGNSAQINNMSSFNRNIGYTDNQLSNYSYNNVKRSYSGQKNYKPMQHLYALPEENKFNSINRITISPNSRINSNKNNIQSNYAPVNPNTKMIQVPKNNINENITNLYPNLEDNTNNSKTYLNSSFNPNLNNRNVNNFYPNQTQNFNANKISTGNNYMINAARPLNSMNIINPKPDYELSRGNNTIGYLCYRNKNSNSNQMPFSVANLDDDDEEDDGRFHELSITKFSRLNPSNKTIGFEQALKQQNQNQNNLNDNIIGRNTFIRKLPPENNNTNSNLGNNNPFKRGISGPVINNQINLSSSNNLENRMNSFGNNINIKKMPPEVNNINNNIGLQKVNSPINNIVPNAATFNPSIQNVNELNKNNNENQNQILATRNISMNFIPQSQPPIMNNQAQINYNLNNRIIPPNDILGRSASPENLQNILQQQNMIQQDITPEENNMNNLYSNLPNEEVEKNNIENDVQNENNIEQKEDNDEQIEQNEEQNVEQNEEQIAENDDIENKKDPNISYNEFDFSGLLKNYGGVTRPGTDANGNEKTDQDTLVNLTNINKVKDFNIFGVLDGHGPDGHHVSTFASDYIPTQIINHPEIKELSDPELIYQKLKEDNCQIITEAFLSCDEQLKKAEFDAYNSGSTCVLIIHVGQHILCANVGDSRALVAYDDNKEDEQLNYLEQAQLSIDYKPELEDEKNRILLSGGVVEQMQNQFGEGVGPYRVWVKGQDYPGLAMSRSIGDLKSKTIGVISEPGILEYDINETTKFIVLASDGVWEFLKNEMVIDIGKRFYIDNDTSSFCHNIVDTSASIWQSKDVVVDDITIVVMFF